MAELPHLLQATFSPDTRKKAETSLDALASHPGFLPHVLRLVLDTAQDRAVRLAACILLKNDIKKRWDEVGPPFTLDILLIFRFTGLYSGSRPR
jgi:exportin-2 (importin alpha re-exporter)